MRRSTIILIIVTGVAVVVFGVILWRATTAPFTDSEIAVPPQQLSEIQPQISASTFSNEPVRLIIPSLHIDANVQKVGITKKGTMGVPTNFTDVGWYKYGAEPGNPGSAVIVGHLDNALSLDGVFKHLNNLKPGDDIYVVNASSTQIHFQVVSTQLFAYDSTSTDAIFAQTSDARLNLITCEGTWDQSKRTYSNRLVVFAVRKP